VGTTSSGTTSFLSSTPSCHDSKVPPCLLLVFFTCNVDPAERIFNPFRGKLQLHPSIGFSYSALAAVLWHLLGAAVVDVQPAVSALLPLMDNPIEHRTTMLTPRRLVVGGALEVVWMVLLQTTYITTMAAIYLKLLTSQTMSNYSHIPFLFL